jgi:hypothetical protein
MSSDGLDLVGGEIMELPSSGYFYCLAALSMAFVGFTSIVVVLHQGTGKPLSPLHFLFTRLFVELGLIATGFSLLAPTLAIGPIREDLVWRLSSVIMLAALVCWLLIFARRRVRATPKKRLPLRYWVTTILSIVPIAALCLNIASVITPGPFPLAITILYVLTYASVVFILNYSLFLRD